MFTKSEQNIRHIFTDVNTFYSQKYLIEYAII